MARVTSSVSGTTTPATVLSNLATAFIAQGLPCLPSPGRRGTAQPGVELRRADPRIVAAGHERSIVQLGTEVAGVSVRGHFARIFPGGQEPADQFVEPDSLRASDFQRIVRRIC